MPFTAHLHVRTDAPDDLIGPLADIIRATARASGQVETEVPSRADRTVVLVVEPGAWIGVYDTSIEIVGDGDGLAARLSQLAPVVTALFGDTVCLGLFTNGERAAVHTESTPGDADRWATILRLSAHRLAAAWRPGDATAEDVLDAVGAALGWGDDEALARVGDLAPEREALRLRFTGAAPLTAFMQRAVAISSDPKVRRALTASWFPERPIVAAHVALTADRSAAAKVARQAFLRWNDTIVTRGGDTYRLASTSAAGRFLLSTELAGFLGRKRGLGSGVLSASLRAGHGFGLSSTRLAKGLADPTLPILSFWLGAHGADERIALKDLVHDLVATGCAIQAVLGQVETVGPDIDLDRRAESLCTRKLLAVPDETFWLGPAFRGDRPLAAALDGIAVLETEGEMTRVSLLEPSRRSQLVAALARWSIAPA